VKSPESLLHQPGKLNMPALPGLDDQPAQPNPFAGIRRAGQAKRAMNFEKWHPGAASAPSAPNASFDGSKYQMQGGQAKTQFGSMRQAKF
jgi:hypothetical protein